MIHSNTSTTNHQRHAALLTLTPTPTPNPNRNSDPNPKFLADHHGEERRDKPDHAAGSQVEKSDVRSTALCRYRVLSCCVVSCRVVLCRVVSCHVMSCRVDHGCLLIAL